MAFPGKVVLVTGAAGGLGKAIAEAFLTAGASVAICDLKADLLQATEREFSDKHSERVLAIEADITDSTAIQRVHDTVLQKFQRLDILVNNAGITDGYDPVGDLSPAFWDKVIAVNLTAPFLFSRLATQQMLKQDIKGGIIINISSVSGVRGMVAGAAYTASKHGVVGLSKNIAATYNNDGIRCVCLLPGGMITPGRNSVVEGPSVNAKIFGKMVASIEPLGFENLDVKDVAQIVLFYSSPAAKICNGAVVSVDGGWLAF